MPIKFWKEIAIVMLTVFVGLFFGLWRYEVLAHNQTSQDLSVAEGTIEQHEKNILITERANNEYQNDIDKLNADVKRLRKRPVRCIPIAIPSDLHSGSGAGSGHGSEDGISSGWLYDYAIEAEKFRIERNNCKKFVNDVWESQR